jgi:hypothetical protein
MKQILLSIFTAVVITGVSAAQTAAQAQAGGSASQSTSVSASRSGAQARSSSAVDAGAQGSAASRAGSHSAKAAGSSQLASGTAFRATLQKPVDARKCKPGDQVIAKSTENVKSDGKVVIPKGSKIIGHVTEVKARGKGESQSEVGIAFDRAILKNGQQVPMAASIQAISMSQQSASSELMGDSMDEGAMAGGGAMGTVGAAPRMGGGSLVGGTTRAVGATGGGTLINTAGVNTAGVDTAGRATGNLGGMVNGGAGSTLSANGELNSASRGVVGLHGLSLESAAAGSTQGSMGSVIRSSSQNVHLDSGTQMILQVAGK